MRKNVKAIPTSRVIAVILWIAVLISAAAVYWNSYPPTEPITVVFDTGSDANELTPVGAVFRQVPWKHLPTIPRFELTDQTGQTFDSAELAGKAYVVNFFFSSCPTICREFNAKVAEMNEKLKTSDIRFVSLTVDPTNDTPAVLERYAQDFGAKRDRWVFLTGDGYKIRQLGEIGFRENVELGTHTESLLLVDRWGRYRDRFKWDDPIDMKRFIHVAREVAAETAPPLDDIFRTRNAMAGLETKDFRTVPWIREFRLTERSGETFYSKDMTGKVWLASFFFTSCPGICKEQNAYLNGLQNRIKDKDVTLVSITTDPNYDSPSVLTKYANDLGADAKRWLFCNGNQLYTKRIGSEFFGAVAGSGHHSSMIFLVDRWGNVRGEFDWQKPNDEVALLKMIDELNRETVPPSKFERRKP